MFGKKLSLRINSLVSDSASQPIQPFTWVISLTPLVSCDFLCSYKGEGVVGGSLQDVWKCLKPVPNGLRVKWDDNVKKFELLEQITEVWQVFFLQLYVVFPSSPTVDQDINISRTSWDDMQICTEEYWGQMSREKVQK